jgi:hypothetical protein
VNRKYFIVPWLIHEIDSGFPPPKLTYIVSAPVVNEVIQLIAMLLSDYFLNSFNLHFRELL